MAVILDSPAKRILFSASIGMTHRLFVSPLAMRLRADGFEVIAAAGDLGTLEGFDRTYELPPSGGREPHPFSKLSEPVIFSRLGGLLEVASERSALYVRPRDAMELSAGITTLLADPERRARMGAAGIEHVRRFAWPAVAKSFRAVYESILANDGSPAVVGRSRAGGCR
jgi:glycosyltransferase involved in cell wall biosynthesis